MGYRHAVVKFFAIGAVVFCLAAGSASAETNTTSQDVDLKKKEMLLETLTALRDELQTTLERVRNCANTRQYYDPVSGTCVTEIDPTVFNHSKAPLPACGPSDKLIWNGSSWNCYADLTN